jgi:hypothetical protein
MTVRQKREVEVYAGIEPIGWDVGVSSPPKTEGPADPQNPPPGIFDQCRKLLGA